MFNVTAPAAVRPGSTININISTPAANVMALQWSTSFPAGYSSSLTVGSAATAAGKLVACTTDLQSICLAYGLNGTQLGAGVVATYALTVPTNTAPGSITVPFVNVLGADATGDPVLLTTASVSFNVLALQDLNGDGSRTGTTIIH